MSSAQDDEQILVCGWIHRHLFPVQEVRPIREGHAAPLSFLDLCLSSLNFWASQHFYYFFSSLYWAHILIVFSWICKDCHLSSGLASIMPFFSFNHIFSESGNSDGIWFWNQGIPPPVANCLSTTDFLVDKLGTSENRMRSLRPTAMLNYNALYLHNVLKYTVSYKGTYLIIF